MIDGVAAYLAYHIGVVYITFYRKDRVGINSTLNKSFATVLLWDRQNQGQANTNTRSCTIKISPDLISSLLVKITFDHRGYTRD